MSKPVHYTQKYIANTHRFITIGSSNTLIPSIVTQPNVTAMTISGSNVGIGTTVPTSTLHVNGQIKSLYQEATNFFNSSSMGTWVILGTYEGTNDFTLASRLELKLLGSSGYNQNVDSGGASFIYVSINNNGSLIVTNANASFINYNYGVLLHAVKLVQVSRAAYTVYAQLGSYQSMSIFATCTGGGKWTTNISTSTDPGANSATVQSGTHLATFTNGSVGIGTTAPLCRLHIKQIGDDATGHLDNVAHAAICLERAENTNRWQIGVNGAEDVVFWYNTVVRGYLLNEADVAQIDFTGQHRSLTISSLNSDHKGLILVSSGLYKNLNGSNLPTINEALPIVELAQVPMDTRVYGVLSDAEDDGTRKYAVGRFVSVFDKDDGDNRLIINALGEGGIWVCDANGSFENGDYITSSAVTGYGMRQNDDVLHSYTVAKITCDCDFSSPPLGFETRFILGNGTQISEEEYQQRKSHDEGVHVAVFVGCTYHCG